MKEIKPFETLNRSRLLMLLALLVPLVLNMLQIGLIEELVEGSLLLKPFFPDNWFFGWIRSTI